MKKYLFLLLGLVSLSPVFGQTYSQSSGNICSAYSYREYTFTGTPETPLAGTLDVDWLYCGPNYNGTNYGRLYMYIWVGGSWQTIANGLQNSNHGCSWVNDTFTLSATTINNAINTAPGGEILIRAYISDGCASGYGCNSYADPCFNATLSYDYAPSADFSADQLSTCIGGEVIFTNLSSGPQDTFNWNFGADADPDTAIGPGPHAVSWTTSGDKDVSLTIVGNGQSSTETKPAYISVGGYPSSVIFGSAFEDWQNNTNRNSIQTQKSIIDANNNTYVSGTFSGSGNDVWLKKIDPDGNTLWDMSYALSGNQSVNDMILDDTNNVYICGVTGSDYFLMKVNSDGSMAWDVAYDPSGNTDVANALCIDPSGYLYVTGASYAAGGTDVTTAKFDNGGTLVFAITETDNGVSEGADIECDNGAIYVFGTMNVGGFNEDWLLVKYETVLGVEQWMQTINGTGFGNDNGHQLILHGTELYLFGESDQTGGFGWTVANYDLNGIQGWKQDYFTGDTGYGTFDGIAVGQNGKLFLASTANAGSSELARVMQLNVADGSPIWIQDFTGINSTYFVGIKTAGDGSIFVSGATYNNSGNLDLCLEQLDENGTQLWWVAYDGCGGATDNMVGLNVTSGNEAIVAGYNIQSVVLKYSPLVAPVAEFSASDTTVCVGESITFSDASTGTSLTYSWNFGAGANPSTATGVGPHDVTYTSAGIKTVSLMSSNSAGDSTIYHTVEIYGLPTITTSGDVAICFGDSTLIEGFGAGNMVWDNGLGAGNSFYVSPADTTRYMVMITDGNTCSNSDSLQVAVSPLPFVSAGADQAICDGENTTLSGAGSGTLSWSHGLGSSATPQVSPTVQTTYILTVTDGNSCVDQDSTTVDVMDCSCANPSNISVSNIGDTEVTISWNAHPNALKYKLKIRVAGTSTWSYHTVLAPDTFKVKGGLIPFSTYEFKIKTVCAVNTPGGYGQFQYFTTTGTPCENPASITMQGINPTQTNASWSAVVGAISYKLKFRPVGSSTWKYKNILAPQSSRNLYNLIPNTQYEYKIRTECNSGSVPYSALAYFNTLDCDVAGNRSTSNITNNSATVNWSAVNGVASYKVKYRINNTTSWSYKNVSAFGTSTQLNNLVSGTTYQWKVKTFCSPNSNYSSYSGNNLFTTTGTGGNASRLAENTSEETSELSVYPNPTTGELTIDLGDQYEDVYVTIRNMTGQVVYQQNLKEARQLQTTIGGAKGLYTVEVHTADGMSGVFRVVKE